MPWEAPAHVDSNPPIIPWKMSTDPLNGDSGFRWKQPPLSEERDSYLPVRRWKRISCISGDEDLNEGASDLIDELLRDDEMPVAVAGFDFETKVIAVTDRRVMIASGTRA